MSDNQYKRVINTHIPGSQPQINANTACCKKLKARTKTNTKKAANHTTAIAVNQQPYTITNNYSNNHPDSGNSIDNLYRALAAGSTLPPIVKGRTITFNNSSSKNLDLYLTVGGTNPQPLKKLATINKGGNGGYIWSIPEDIYGWNGNFTAMPSGVTPPQYNAGPTIAEFGLNQYWHGAVPPMRDTFDISTVPPGIGTSVNNGPRSAAVAASIKAGFKQQQAYNYNVGIQISSGVQGGALPTVTVTCTTKNGDCLESIGYPNDTAVPKQQTGVATGNYTVKFLDPVVDL